MSHLTPFKMYLQQAYTYYKYNLSPFKGYLQQEYTCYKYILSTCSTVNTLRDEAQSIFRPSKLAQ